MLHFIKKIIREDYINLFGWSSERNIIVIESDDWGSIRTSSKKAYDSLKDKGLPLELDPYSKYDSLESNEDLEALFDILYSIKDSQGQSAIFTANNIVANPNFEKIKNSGFSEYFYEPFTETLKRYSNHGQVEKLYREGIETGIFRPQFHGREHLHVNNWLKALQNNDHYIRLAFENEMFAVYKNKNERCKEQFLDGFAVYSDLDEEFLNKSIKEGCDLFEHLWGFKSESIISPCLIWNPSSELVFKNCGIKYIQSGPKQTIPNKNGIKNASKRHYIGEKNKLNQIYSIRNVNFEPSITNTIDVIPIALKSIEKAFFNKKPAIISSHRLNYTGNLNESNRTQNLKLLKELLAKALIKWPSIEFMSSDKLGRIMEIKKF